MQGTGRTSAYLSIPFVHGGGLHVSDRRMFPLHVANKRFHVNESMAQLMAICPSQ